MWSLQPLSRWPAGVALFPALFLLAALPSEPAPAQSKPPPAKSALANAAPACAADSGLTLPAGFCATVFADKIWHARHLTVARNGVVYVNTWDRHRGGEPAAAGYLVALQDTTGNGKADVIKRFGGASEPGGTGVALYRGALYAENRDRIERYKLAAGSIVPQQQQPEIVVSGLPLGGDHPMHPFAIDATGALYVDVASATNACQHHNRQLQASGAEPCTELKTRGGIWRFDANRTGQKFSPAERFATGIRNADGIAVAPSGHGILATQHGRDQLHENWPALYRPEQEATLPAEELLQVSEGGDYGWPECYFDEVQGKLVLAPEYGGDGGHAVGPCAQKLAPLASFPAHWAPNDVVVYTGNTFPARYHGGVFIAFHGSWDRAPYPQGGYNVVFQALAGGKAKGRCEVFADGFAGAVKEPGEAEHRPSGVAVGPDGALYVSDDSHGRIYRIAYHEGANPGGSITPCPPPDAPSGSLSAENAASPATHAADVALPVPAGSSRQAVALGDDIFHGRVGAANCSGCHGPDAAGTPQGPALTGSRTWLWSDGSYPGIARTIHEGVPQPKQYSEPMPAMGGAELSSKQVSAVAAYVWALSHQ